MDKSVTRVIIEQDAYNSWDQWANLKVGTYTFDLIGNKASFELNWNLGRTEYNLDGSDVQRFLTELENTIKRGGIIDEFPPTNYTLNKMSVYCGDDKIPVEIKWYKEKEDSYTENQKFFIALDRLMNNNNT